ncbi:MAG: hypothetical protein U1F77_13470 [Kiritimatiellia bacterium]
MTALCMRGQRRAATWGLRTVLAALLLAAAPAPADPVPDAATTSADRRFAATGPNQEDNLRLVRWAEKNTRSLEDFLGLKLQIPAHSPLVIRSRPAATNETAGVTISQRIDGVRLLQELRIVDFRKADSEDLLEAFTLLLLHRAVHDLRAGLPAAKITGPAAVPAWFATGCAQNLYRETRARNRLVVLRAFQAGGGTGAADLLRLQSLPRGRWSTKAECGVFVAWLASRPDFPAFSAALLRRFAAGGTADAPWFCDQLADASAPDDLEKHWDLWRMHSEQVRPEDTGVFDDAPGRLAALFPVPASRLARLGAAGAKPIEAADLAACRADHWFPALVGSLRAETLTLAAGQPPEFQQIIAQWNAWYQALLDLPLTARETPSGRVEYPAELRRQAAVLLQQAQASLFEYRRKLHGLAQYVDRFEAQAAAALVPAPADPAPRTEQQKYVDRFDAARNPPAPPDAPPQR